MSKYLIISNLRAELSAKADLINWLSRLSTAIVGRFGGKSHGETRCGCIGVVRRMPAGLLCDSRRSGITLRSDLGF